MILVSILVFLSFWATTPPARASDSDCESFMYGSLCSTGRLSDIIWVIPHLENEKKCQVSNESTLSGLKLDTCFFSRGSAWTHPTATTSCSWNSQRGETRSASSSEPVTQTPLQLVLTNQTARWQYRDL